MKEMYEALQVNRLRCYIEYYWHLDGYVVWYSNWEKKSQYPLCVFNMLFFVRAYYFSYSGILGKP